MKLISIFGPTATGKTQLALNKAQELMESGEYKGVNLISADSRQVYRGLEIISGADIPKEFQALSQDILKAQAMSGLGLFPIYKHSSQPIFLHGVSVLDLTSDWSLAHFIVFAKKIISWSQAHQFAVIVVGGTGLYHKHLLANLGLSAQKNLTKSRDIFIKPNPKIRQVAETMKTVELIEWLKKIDLSKYQSMNDSDRQNPRRLVRAIEIGLAKAKKNIKPDFSNDQQQVLINSDQVEIIQQMPQDLDDLKTKIMARVKQRLQAGAIDEVKKCLKLNLDFQSQVMTTLGVPEISQFLTGKISKTELIELWTLHELQYAKRQITWLKKTSINNSH